MKIGRYQLVWNGIANVGKRARSVGAWPWPPLAPLYSWWACGPLEIRCYQ
jgi:hypothetical protein